MEEKTITIQGAELPLTKIKTIIRTDNEEITKIELENEEFVEIECGYEDAKMLILEALRQIDKN